MERNIVQTRDLMAQLDDASGGRMISDEQLQFPPLIHNTELAYVNQHFGIVREVRRDGAGGLSTIKHWIKSVIARLVFGSLSEYFSGEQEFINHLVRFQNEIARSLDAASDQANKAIVGMREALRLAEESRALHRLLDERISQLANEREH